MKQLFTILCTTLLLAVVSCNRYEEIWETLRDHEQRIEQLEKLCKELNSNVQAAQAILTAVQQNDYVTDIMKIVENGVEVGYCLTFAKGGTVNIFHGSDGADGTTPDIGIRKALDGAYYWTSGGEWLTNDQGDMIPATVTDPDGGYVTPQFRIAEGIWFVSYDNGNSWREISPSEEEDDELFQNVTYDQNYIYITLSDGSQFKILYKTDSKVVDLFIFMGQSNMSGRGVASEAPEVPEGWGFEYKAISDPGKLLHMVEPFGLYEDNATSGVDDSNGENGNKRKGSSVSALTIAYYQHTNVPVVGVSCSKGGTSTTFWKVGGKPLNDAIARQLAAEQWLTDNGYTIRNNYMFWLQGESDNSMSPDIYKSNLISIVKEMIEKTGVTNCMMLRVGQQNTATATKKNNIIEAQTELCQTYTEFVMASTLIAGFPDDGLMKDTWHYTQEGYNILGTDAGKNVAFYANNGIEPNMYDPYYQGLYYPINKYTSIFDTPIVPDGYTTVGTARTLVKIVDSYQDFTFVNGYTFGGGSDRNFKQKEGRATSMSEILRVSGGEIVSLLQPIEGEELTYGMTEFMDKPCTVETLTSQGQKAVDWLNGDVTLQDDTRYIIVTFKKANTTAFTDSELQLLKEALKVRHEIPVEVPLPSDGILAEYLFVKLEDTWLTESANKIQIGIHAGYHMCYLPADLSGYNSISVTANDEHNAYFQFFKDDNLKDLCGTRIVVEKGETMVVTIPDGAKYLVMSHSRTNLTDVADGYGSYFPETLIIYRTTDDVPTEIWADKKILMIGDSITAGSGTTKTYWSILDETLQPESMTGMGVAGSCVSATSDYGTSNSPLINRYTSIPESDIITIYMGTNDYGHETPMGTIDDAEDISFYGALNVIISGIRQAQPDAQLVWITPTHRYGFGTSKMLGTKFTYDYLPNGRGYSLEDYVDAIKDVCAKYSVPVIDLFNLSGMDPSLSEVRTQYMPDGLHPNAAGHEKIAAIIASSLTSIVANH